MNGTLLSPASPGEDATPGAAPSAPIDWESGGESRSLEAEGANAEVTLSWPARTAITNYPVEIVWQYCQRDASGGATRCTGRGWGAWQNITSGTTPNGYLTSRYTVKSLTNGKIYCFQVRGKVGALEGVPSLEARARPTASPEAPGLARLLDVRPGNQQVNLFVIRPLRTVSYEVRQKTTTAANCNSGSWDSPAAVSHSYEPKVGNIRPRDADKITVTSLVNDTKYCFQVRAANANSRKGDWSTQMTTSSPVSPSSSAGGDGLQASEPNIAPDDQIVAIDLGGPVPTEAPEPVAAVNVTHNGNSLAVTWEAPARATHYDVTYSGGGVNARAAWNRPGTSITIRCDSRSGYENQNCVTGTTSYTVAVRSRNAAGTSTWTNSPPASLAPPEPVAEVTAVHRGNSLEVSWEAPARASHYDVTYTNTSSGGNARAAWNRAGTSITIRCDSRSGDENQNCVSSTSSYTVGVRARHVGSASSWVNSPEATPPALSVANATVAEPGAGQSATLDFVVSLSHAAAAAVRVDYATSNGTATAGADYTAATGTLTFAAGETSKTVSVPVLNDAHDEGSETLTLTLSNVTGAVIKSGGGTATGTITNDDPIPQAWLSPFGRTVAHQVLDAVDTRMDSQPTPGLEVTLAGQPVQWPDGDESQGVAEQVVEQLAQWVSISSDGATGAVPSLQENDLLANSSFAFGSPTGNGGLFSFWGRGAVANFDGPEGDLTLDGEVITWLLGTDWSWGLWPDGGEARRSTAGLMVSRSSSDGSYDSTDPSRGSGDVTATLTGVFPWGRHRFTERLEAWGAAGYRQGELEVTPKLPSGQDGATLSTDLNLWLAAAGLRGTLLDGGNHGITLTGKTDVMAVGTSSGKVTGQDGNLAAADATVTRLRLGLEAQQPFSFGEPEADSRATLTPSLELGLRLDGGDAETGFGLDLGGGFTLSHPARGLQAEVRGRGLLSHAAEGFRD